MFFLNSAHWRALIYNLHATVLFFKTLTNIVYIKVYWFHTVTPITSYILKEGK